MSSKEVLLIESRFQKLVLAAECEEFTFWFFSLRLEDLFPLFTCLEIGHLHSFKSKLTERGIFRASNSAAADCQRIIATIKPQLDLEHRGELLRMASRVLNEAFNAMGDGNSSLPRRDDHFLIELTKLSADDLLNSSIEELAAKFGYSRRHLNRLSQVHFGFSIGSLRMETRLLKAICLLRDPNAKVSNVALECGFNHLGLFNICFRKRFGTTPGRWKSDKGEKEVEAGLTPKNDLLQVKALSFLQMPERRDTVPKFTPRSLQLSS